jgi:cytochrome d ubiquinol oxidase subunit II
MLMNRSEGAIYRRAREVATRSGLAALFSLGGIWVSVILGYHLVQSPDPASAQTPLQQVVEQAPGAWLANYRGHGVLWLIPASAYVLMLIGIGALRRGWSPRV